jgi:ribonuclease HI
MEQANFRRTTSVGPIRYHVKLYADGGVINSNPSQLGGTWAWVHVDELGKLVRWDAGVITPKEASVEAVSNNLTELLAVVNAIAATPPGWSGVICTDSKVTAMRITKGFIPHDPSVPRWLRRKLWGLKERRRWRVVLVRGHPNKAELEAGWSQGLPVDKWNVWCDKKCNQLAKGFTNGSGIENT